MPVIGTAGHVDHGKSTLVQALTGRDPDRWAEEKARGLTIDLGFAWTTLDDGNEISFVDVPGHEKFIKNMLAGTDGFDVALFVVAADEGWMPQSEEHLAVLDLLGVGHAVVALTKIDRVDEDLVELATLEIEEKLAGTTLASAPIVGVSAPASQGLDRLRAALTEAVAASPSAASGRPRLWVDRAFTISGAGTVATGTLTGGPLSVGDQIELHPGPLAGRIRSLQSHESDRQTASPGSRVAVNIVGLERQDIERGAMLGRPGDWIPSGRILVTLRRARYVDEDLTNRGAYHLHLGSGAWPVRLRAVGHLADGTEVAILTVSQPVPVQMGDRFILREVGRRSIVAGGRVLEPIAPPKGKNAAAASDSLAAALDASPDDKASSLLARRGVAHVDQIRAHSGGGTATDGVVTGSLVMLAARVDQLGHRASALVQAFHSDNPLRPGMPKASLASQLGIEPEALTAVLARSDGLEERGSTIAIAGFTTTLNAENEAEWERIHVALTAAGLTVPRLKELAIDQELLHVLLREERLVKVSDELVYLPQQLNGLVDGLTELPDRFTVAEFRDTLGLTRKYAVPLLEWLDRRRVTVRDGDTRTIA